MRSLIKLGLGYGLLTCAIAMADGYYPRENDGPGSVNWPPPGGAFVFPPPAPGYVSPLAPGYYPYPDSWPIQPYHYRPAQRFNSELIEPPGTDWPGAAYYEPPGKMPPPLHRPPAGKGVPVGIVPSPGIPAEEVSAPSREKPESAWRPVEKQQPEPLEETAVAPEFAGRTEPVMREPAPNVSPSQAKEASSPFVSGMAIARPQTLRLPPLDKPAEK